MTVSHKRRHWQPLLAGIGVLAVTGPGEAQTVDTDLLRDWQISGSLTGRVESFSDAGDPAQSPFNERSIFEFAEGDVSFSRQVSPWESVRGNFFGVFNNNPFRSQFEGFVPERAKLEYEKGDAGLPFRVEAGDIFAFSTARTVQRALKGVQIEVQPELGSGDWNSSAVAYWGANQAVYRQVDFDDEQAYGGSFLLNRGNTTLSMNLAANRFGSGANGVAVVRNQTVGSIAGDHKFTVADQDLELKAELGMFYGDDAAGARLNQYGGAWFTELGGRSKSMPLDYSVRFQQIDSDYRPAGAGVSAGRRSLNTSAGWRFKGGVSLRGRAAWDRDNFGRANRQDTLSAGANLSGPFDLPWGKKATGSLDYAATSTENAAGTVDNLSNVISVNLSSPITEKWNGRVSYSFQSQETLNAAPIVTNQMNLGVDRSFRNGDWSGSISPGFSYRRINGGGGEGDDVTASFGANLAWQQLSLRADYRATYLFRDAAGGDTISNRFTSTLNWQSGPHRLGVEMDYNVQTREAARASQPLKVAAFYTFTFGKQPGESLFGGGGQQATFTASPVAAQDLVDITVIRPGEVLKQALTELAELGLTGGQAQNDDIVLFETPALTDINLRQRLALRHENQRVRDVMIIVDPTDVNNGRQVEQDFNNILSELIDAYGRPDTTFDRGDFNGNVVTDVDDGELVRLAEWRTNSGILRLGIPRRLDRQVRIEIHHARSFPPPSHTLWGVETLR